MSNNIVFTCAHAFPNYKCHYCENKSTYTQPHRDTGEIIDVCDTHFSYKFWG